MSLIKAVIFTHCAGLRYKDDDDYRENERKFVSNYKESFMRFLDCNRDEVLVTDVFAYIDQGLKAYFTKKIGSQFELDIRVYKKEQTLKGLLMVAERQARDTLKLDRGAPPKFHYVGLHELTDLLSKIWNVDPNLLSPGIFLGGNNAFTYDSPKFAEAVIRLARGDIPHLAENPIIRIDDDADINPKSIKILLEAFTSASSFRPFYFFSGRYGREDKNPDIVNNFAVRTEWFFPVGTKAGDDRFENPDEEFYNHMLAAEIFLADLQIIGARQPSMPDSKLSENLKDAMEKGLCKNIKKRSSPQVVSGAGLIMARRNVALLPPFINCTNLITWIDDYLKRELHEMLGDMTEYDPQCIEEAIFQQDRNPLPEGITKDKITSAGSYLKRVMLGCMFSAIIGDQSKDPNYTGVLKDIVVYKLEYGDFDGSTTKSKLQQNILDVAFEHYKLVLWCWMSQEFRNYEIYNWANGLWQDLKISSVEEKTTPSIVMNTAPQLVKDIVNDAMNYLDLVFRWHKFTRAIERLEFIGNNWLYE